MADPAGRSCRAPTSSTCTSSTRSSPISTGRIRSCARKCTRTYAGGWKRGSADSASMPSSTSRSPLFSTIIPPTATTASARSTICCWKRKESENSWARCATRRLLPMTLLRSGKSSTRRKTSSRSLSARTAISPPCSIFPLNFTETAKRAGSISRGSTSTRSGTAFSARRRRSATSASIPTSSRTTTSPEARAACCRMRSETTIPKKRWRPSIS